MELTKEITIREIRNIPEFAPVSRYLVGGPVDPLEPNQDIPLGKWSKMERGLADSVLSGFRRLYAVAQEGTYLYPIYSAEECAADPDKKDVNVVHFPAIGSGKDKPYVIVCAGGAFQTVWSMNEGYPVAAKLNELGYSAFVLNYRVGGTGLFPKPMDDLAAAVRWIGANAEHLSVNENRYVVCGFSAGGTLVGEWGTERNGYRKYGLPKPEALFPIYPAVHMSTFGKTDGVSRFLETMHGVGYTPEMVEAYDIDTQATKNFPPSYLVCCLDDNEVPYVNSVRLKERLEELGVPVKLEIGKEGRHGFGEGIGTDVEGWVERAIRFLESEWRIK